MRRMIRALFPATVLAAFCACAESDFFLDRFVAAIGDTRDEDIRAFYAMPTNKTQETYKPVYVKHPNYDDSPNMARFDWWDFMLPAAAATERAYFMGLVGYDEEWANRDAFTDYIDYWDEYDRWPDVTPEPAEEDWPTMDMYQTLYNKPVFGDVDQDIQTYLDKFGRDVSGQARLLYAPKIYPEYPDWDYRFNPWFSFAQERGESVKHYGYFGVQFGVSTSSLFTRSYIIDSADGDDNPDEPGWFTRDGIQDVLCDAVANGCCASHLWDPQNPYYWRTVSGERTFVPTQYGYGVTDSLRYMNIAFSLLYYSSESRIRNLFSGEECAMAIDTGFYNHKGAGWSGDYAPGSFFRGRYPPLRFTLDDMAWMQYVIAATDTSFATDPVFQPEVRIEQVAESANFYDNSGKVVWTLGEFDQADTEERGAYRFHVSSFDYIPGQDATTSSNEVCTTNSNRATWSVDRWYASVPLWLTHSTPVYVPQEKLLEAGHMGPFYPSDNGQTEECRIIIASGITWNEKAEDWNEPHFNRLYLHLFTRDRETMFPHQYGGYYISVRDDYPEPVGHTFTNSLLRGFYMQTSLARQMPRKSLPTPNVTDGEALRWSSRGQSAPLLYPAYSGYSRVGQVDLQVVTECLCSEYNEPKYRLNGWTERTSPFFGSAANVPVEDILRERKAFANYKTSMKFEGSVQRQSARLFNMAIAEAGRNLEVTYQWQRDVYLRVVRNLDGSNPRVFTAAGPASGDPVCVGYLVFSCGPFQFPYGEGDSEEADFWMDASFQFSERVKWNFKTMPMKDPEP